MLPWIAWLRSLYPVYPKIDLSRIKGRCWMRMCFSIEHFCSIKQNRGTTIGPFLPVPHWHVIECIFFESVIVKGVHFPFYKVKWMHPTHCGFFFSTFERGLKTQIDFGGILCFQVFVSNQRSSWQLLSLFKARKFIIIKGFFPSFLWLVCGYLPNKHSCESFWQKLQICLKNKGAI